MLKIFYDKTTWRGFYPPEKQLFTKTANKRQLLGANYFESDEYERYDKAYAEAKRNAMEIGNPEIIMSNTPLGGFEIQFIDGVGCSTWPGKSEIKDGKIYLSV